MARRGQDRNGARRPPQRTQRRARDQDLIGLLARTVREVESAVQRAPVTPTVRTKFQAIALLLREEHARVRAGETGSEARRTEQLKRLDGIAAILGRTAVRDSTLLALLADDAVISPAAAALRSDMLASLGLAPAEEPPAAAPEPVLPATPPSSRCCPRTPSSPRRRARSSRRSSGPPVSSLLRNRRPRRSPRSPRLPWNGGSCRSR